MGDVPEELAHDAELPEEGRSEDEAAAPAPGRIVGRRARFDAPSPDTEPASEVPAPAEEAAPEAPAAESPAAEAPAAETPAAEAPAAEAPAAEVPAAMAPAVSPLRHPPRPSRSS